MIKTEVTFTSEKFGDVFKTIVPTQNIDEAIDIAKKRYGEYTKELKVKTNYVVTKEE